VSSRPRRRLGRLVIFAILCVVAVVMLFPFVLMIVTSFRSRDQYVAGSGFSLDSWRQLFAQMPVLQELWNSTLVTVGGVALILVASTTGGYAFSKLTFKGSGLVFLAILSGMMIPVQSIIIPVYVNIVNVARVHVDVFGLNVAINQVFGINQLPSAIVVYAALGAPFATYLMTTYYRGIPTELVEASVMDGASYWQIFRSVMLPLAIPAITTVAVLQVIQIWDDLLVGLLFLQTPAVRTITVGLAVLQNGRVVSIPLLMAGSLVSALPAIIVYLIFQRNLIQGLTMGVNK
jgi:multiple sugar transport system permease protein/raffinose/stachyose/melibiose transport system permease protein